MSRWIVAICAALSIAAAWGTSRMERVARPRIRPDAEGLPLDALVVLLGCPVRNRAGLPNRYFLARAEAGAKAYHALEARRAKKGEAAGTQILCSGLDTHGEVTAFVEALTRAGVPEQRIRVDGAARRTRDSVEFVATHEPGRTIAFVSQRLHLPRVLFLARRGGVDGYGICTRGDLHGTRARLRERLARLRALIDPRPRDRAR